MTPLVEMRGVCLAFPGTQALDGASISIGAGEIRAVLGENGAGKSTLMKVLAGAEQADEGEVRIAGEPVEHRTPADAGRSGVHMVFQEMSLAPNLTVAENITVGHWPTRAGGLVDWAAVRLRARAAVEALGVDLPLDRPVRTLGVAGKQLVEIAKALATDLRVLVLDEPTSALTDQDAQRLFAVVRELARSGVAVVFISHNIEEILQLCDSVTIMRDGVTVDTRDTGDVTVDDLIAMMVGRSVDDLMPKQPATLGEVVLEVEGLLVPGRTEPVSFTVRRGEVLGLAGLMGSGRTALMRTLIGDIRRAAGRVRIGGRDLDPKRPGDAVAAGLGYLSDDRRASGIVGLLSIRENISIGSLRAVSTGGFVSARRERALAASIIDRLRVATPSMEQRIRLLSGGNQQKVVLGKWMAAGVDVLVLDEPTRGIDVPAKSAVYQLINELAAEGKAIILVSSYLPEVLGMSDRVLVLRGGAVAAEFPAAQATSEAVMFAATGQRRSGPSPDPIPSTVSATISTKR